MNASILILLGGLAIAAFLYLHKRTRTGDNSGGWVIGPTIHGENHSVKMPARPTMQGKGWTFDFPGPDGKVDYVQNFDPPNLVGATAIVLRCRVTGGGFVAAGSSNPATVTVCIQRRGDDWSAKGKFESYRYYADLRTPLAAGEYVLTFPLEVSRWGSVMHEPDNAANFAACLRELDCLAVVFGAKGGAGHGVYATQPSQFTLLGLEVR
jgi:hypothetical protein